MGKIPALNFYPGDWFRETGLSMTDLKTKGAWIEMLLRMFDAPERGKLQGTPEDFCQMLHCSDDDFSHIINEIKSKKIADVTFHDGIVTVINRRMRRDEKDRESAKIRMREKRVRDGGYAVVTEKLQTLLSSSSSSSVTKVTYSVENGTFINITKPHLQTWSKAYPAINIENEISKAEAWIKANPKNKKSNWERFIVNWLSRAQDKAPPLKNDPYKPPLRETVYVNCKKCRKEILPEDNFGDNCIHCADRVPIEKIKAMAGSIGMGKEA
jgi:hypothetical protein